jgi:hypothetical protein
MNIETSIKHGSQLAAVRAELVEACPEHGRRTLRQAQGERRDVMNCENINKKRWLARGSPHGRWRCSGPPMSLHQKNKLNNFGNCQQFETEGVGKCLSK